MSLNPLTCFALTALLLSGLPALLLTEHAFFSQPAAAQTTLKAEADRLLQQSNDQLDRSQFRESLQSSQQALQRYRQLRDRQGEAQSLVNLGLAYDALSKYPEAIEVYQQSLTISREIGNRQGEAASLTNLGLVYDVLGSYPEAIEFHQQSLSIFREIGNRRGEAASLTYLGLVYSHLGNYSKAIEFYQQSLPIAREINDRLREAEALGNLGNAYDALGNYGKAIEFHQQSLVIARRIGNRLGEAAALGNLGNAYSNQGNYHKAIDFHGQSLAIKRNIGNRQGEATSLNNLGNAYDTLGDYGKAIEFYQQSLTIRRDIGNQRGEASSLGRLGFAYQNLGDYHKAIEFHQQQRTIAQKIGDLQGEAASLAGLGIAYDSLKDYHKAIAFHLQRRTITQKIGDRHEEANALGHLGFAYASLKDYGKAIDFLQQSLIIKRDIGDRLGEAESLRGLGIVYDALGNYSKAIDFQQQSLVIEREIGNQWGAAAALNNLGLAFLQTNQLPQASHFLYQSVQIKETLWRSLGPDNPHKLSFFEKDPQIHRNLQLVLVLQDQPEQALEIAERGRTRTLVEQMARPLQRPATIAPLPLEEMKRLATEQQATLVVYSVMDVYETLLVWVISPNGQIEFKAVDLDAADGSLADLAQLSRRTAENLRGDSGLTALVRSSHQAIVSETPALTQDPLQQLHQILIRPIADFLPAADSHIVFIPHEELFRVPFAALKDEQGDFLIQKYAISTAPSLQALALAQQHRKRVQGKAQMALVVGNPAFPEQLPEGVKSLDPLPNAEAEARSIAATHFSTQPLLGAAATETAVVQQLHQARIIHLATHGLALDPPNSFDLSGRIALAPSATDDGWLTATELVQLTRDNPLNAEMVVLSACDTGLGRVTGDGILGLSRALIVAGVPSIVVSLWQVPDPSTQYLMERFYEELKISEKHAQVPNRAQALRQAMLKTMEVYNLSVGSWAAFTLVGTAQ